MTCRRCTLWGIRHANTAAIIHLKGKWSSCGKVLFSLMDVFSWGGTGGKKTPPGNFLTVLFTFLLTWVSNLTWGVTPQVKLLAKLELLASSQARSSAYIPYVTNKHRKISSSLHSLLCTAAVHTVGKPVYWFVPCRRVQLVWDGGGGGSVWPTL